MKCMVLSQEGAPGTHKTTRQISRETGISQRSVGRIGCRSSLHSATNCSQTMEQTSSISSRSLSVGHLRVLSSIARLWLCS